MRAALCKSLDGPDAIEIEEIADPIPEPDEVLIQVRATALNFFDTLIVRNQYQFKPPLPFAPGAEIAGEIEALGEQVEDFAIGDRVLAYIGWGGCQGKVAVKADQVALLPDGIDDAAASGVSVTYGTAMHGLKDRAELKSGETVVVIGASGGAGLAAVEIAKVMGARVIAVASSEEKLEVCRAHGADELVNYRSRDLKEALKTLTDGLGVDVVYDCVGGAASEAALRATAWEGRFLVIGFAAGEIPRIPLNLVLLKGCSIVGVFWGDFLKRDPGAHRANVEQILQWCAEGRLKPHIHGTYPLEQIKEALGVIERREAKGKVIVTP